MATCSSKFSGTIRLEKDEFVSISIDEESGSPAAVHNCPAHDVALHVINAVRKKRPRTFDAFPSGNLCGTLSASARLSQEAVKNLPLVDDLVSSAKWASDDTSGAQTTHFTPPTGIWPLISLLLVLEAGLDDKETRLWLSSSSGDPKLLGETLQMADFMGHKFHRAPFVMKELCGIFTDVFRSISDVHTAVKDVSSVKFNTEDKFKCMVVSHLPDRFCKDALTDKFSLEQAFQKPDDAFVQWLQGHGPALHLEPLLAKKQNESGSAKAPDSASQAPPPRSSSMFGSSRASPSGGPMPATQPSTSYFGGAFATPQPFFGQQQPPQPPQAPSLFGVPPTVFGSPVSASPEMNSSSRSTGLNSAFGPALQHQDQTPGSMPPYGLFSASAMPNQVSGTTNEAASAAQKDQQPASRGKGKPLRSARYRSGAGVHQGNDPLGFSFPNLSQPDASRRVTAFDKIFRCLQRCPGITTLQGSMVLYVQTFNAMAGHYACQGEISSLNCPVQGVHFDNITMDDVSEKFGANSHPLGLLGSGLKSLRFKSVTLSSKTKKRTPESLCGLPDSTAQAARRWAFFRAIGRLKSLKQLAVPLDFWADITSCGMDVTAPLQELQDLVVESVADGHVIARVVDRRVVQELQETTVQFTQAETRNA